MEDKYFHWLTNRALRDLVAQGVLLRERRQTRWGGELNLVWHRSFRYYRREATRVLKLVEEYSDPNIGGALGLHAELLILEGFAQHEFVMKGRNTQRHGAASWAESGHDLDFVFERDGRAYGVEVKNTLGYMEYDEFQVKVRLCKHLGLTPMFVARMMPRSWIFELGENGGFALILKYQLYPPTHKALATRVAGELGLPVGSPRALNAGTMMRFVKWHTKSL